MSTPEAYAVREKWQKRVGEFLPEFIARTPALAAISADLDVVFHGSTTLGIDDAWSDLNGARLGTGRCFAFR